MAEENIGSVKISEEVIAGIAATAACEVEGVIRLSSKNVSSAKHIVANYKQIAKGVNGGGYCTACFDGNYPTEIPKAPMKNRFETKISENKE